MRQGQSKRIRGRSRGGGGGGGGNGGGGGGKGPNQLNRSYESNGPDVKIRGTAGTIADKYVQLSRDALSAGDPVSAENYMQHAEHYYRLLAAAQAQYQPHQTVVRADADDFSDVDFDDENGDQPGDQNGQQAGQPNGYQPNGQNPQQQNRQQNNGRQYDNRQNDNRQGDGRQGNGYNGQQRDDQRRVERNDRGDRNNDRGDRNDRNRDRYDRSEGGENREARSDDRRNDRPRDDRPYNRQDRGERAPRPETDDQPEIGGLPAFITGGQPVPTAPVAVAPAAPVVAAEPEAAPAPEPRSRRSSPRVERVEAPAETAAVEAPVAEISGAEDGDPREDGAAAGRTRRRRYGRRGPAADGEGAELAPQPAETTSD